MKRYLEMEGLGKVYGAGAGTAVVVEDFALALAQGEFVSIIGHSGCGKSTVLSMVAGLSEPSAGRIRLGGRALEGPGTDRGVVFQAPCLLHWLSALGNVRLGVDQVYPRESRAARDALARHYLHLVGLEGALGRRPAELSQGMRQRVGLARAFALSPQVLLLDEPFGMLDSLTRLELQDVLLQLWSQDRKTALMVTHDVDEALYLSDRVVLMTNGPAARVGEVVEVPFGRPRTRAQVLEDPRYAPLRERLIGFLEEQAHHPGPRSAACEPRAAAPEAALA